MLPYPPPPHPFTEFRGRARPPRSGPQSRATPPSRSGCAPRRRPMDREGRGAGLATANPPLPPCPPAPHPLIQPPPPPRTQPNPTHPFHMLHGPPPPTSCGTRPNHDARTHEHPLPAPNERAAPASRRCASTALLRVHGAGRPCEGPGVEPLAEPSRTQARYAARAAWLREPRQLGNRLPAVSGWARRAEGTLPARARVDG
jgi:hypothetical protein